MLSGLLARTDRKQIKARWSPRTIAGAESPRVHSPGSASSAPASPATPRPPAMPAQQAQQPGDSSPDPSLPSTPKAAPATASAILQSGAQLGDADSRQALSRRAYSQPLHDKAPAALDSSDAEPLADEPRIQAAMQRPSSAQDHGSRLQSMPHLAELGAGQKGRPRSLTFPLQHQRHLEPSRLSPQTPLTSAPGSHVKVSLHLRHKHPAPELQLSALTVVHILEVGLIPDMLPYCCLCRAACLPWLRNVTAQTAVAAAASTSAAPCAATLSAASVTKRYASCNGYYVFNAASHSCPEESLTAHNLPMSFLLLGSVKRL